MQYLNKIEEYQGQCRTVVTLGKFDGFHKGHQKLLYTESLFTRELQVTQDDNGAADMEKIESIVFAFDMLEFRKSQNLPYEQIMLREEREMYLQDRVDYFIECPFDKEIRCMSAHDFIVEVLVKRLRAKYLVVGTDFRFGFQAQGDVQMLREYAGQHHYEVIEIEKELYGDKEISSSYIRSELACGNMEAVNEMLGYTYSIEGRVVTGNQIGRTIGFPTMNILPSTDKFLPLYGVYVVEVELNQGHYYGIANVGKKPTVSNEKEVLVEVHVFDYEEEAYGETVRVSFLKMLRTEKKFDSVEDLRVQIEKDRISARSML